MINNGTINDLFHTLSAIPPGQRSAEITGLLCTVNRIYFREGPAPAFFVMVDLDSCTTIKARKRNESVKESVRMSLKEFELNGKKHYAVLIE